MTYAAGTIIIRILQMRKASSVFGHWTEWGSVQFCSRCWEGGREAGFCHQDLDDLQGTHTPFREKRNCSKGEIPTTSEQEVILGDLQTWHELTLN